MEQAKILEAIHAAIDDERNYVVALTSAMVHIPSVNPKFETGEGLNREADVQALLAEHIGPLGAELERWEVFPAAPI